MQISSLSQRTRDFYYKVHKRLFPSKRIRKWSRGYIWTRNILISAGVIALSACVCITAVVLYGRNSFKTEEVPSLVLAAEDDYDGWQEGDIRYNGKIYRYNSDMITLLFMGIDSMDKVEAKDTQNEGGQSDMMFLFCMDPHTNEVTVITINRNTMVDIAVYTAGGSYLSTVTGQIALQHGYGDGAEISCERAVEVVSDLIYGMPIHGYCSVNMGAITEINDAVGGVQITSLETFTSDVYNNSFVEGKDYFLTGTMAFDYVKYRDTSIFGSADMRLARQKQYLVAFASALKGSLLSDPTEVIAIYKLMSDYICTDLSLSQMTYLATQLASYSFDSDEMLSLEGETVMGERYEEFYVDEDALLDLIIEVFYEEVTD